MTAILNSTNTNVKPVIPAEPLISVIIPVYQAESFIKTTVHNVLQQTYNNFELIIVDDGCTDATIERVKEFKSDKIRIVHQENKGVAAARNFGFQFAQGEYITFLDSDDLWLPSKLAIDVKTLITVPNPVCIIYNGFYYVNNKVELVGIPRYYTGGGNVFRTMLTCNIGNPGVALLHRQVFEAVGGFPSECYHDDRVFFLKALKRFPAFPTGKRTLLYRQTSEGRLRNILAQYQMSVDAENSILRSLKDDFTAEELQILSDYHKLSLFSRFLRFDVMESARIYATEVPVSFLTGSFKGFLCFLTLYTGFNFLRLAQIIVENCSNLLLKPWWFIYSINMRRYRLN
jgi:glycosyltransferase involved in cell wall biosynthesis